MSRALATVLCALLLAAVARAGVIGSGDGGHGWIAGIPDGMNGYAVFHLGPRSSLGGQRGSSVGSIQRLETTRVPPIAMASWGDRVTMIFENDTAGGSLPVRSLAAYPGPHRRSWVPIPPDRLAVEETLPITREALLGLCGSPAGEVALVAEVARDDGPVVLGLRVLSEGGWIAAQLPSADDRVAANAPPTFERSRLVQTESGPGLFVVAEDGRVGLWRGHIEIERQTLEQEAGQPQVVWSARASWRYKPLHGFGDELDAELGPVEFIGGRLIMFVRSGKDWVVRSISEQSATVLATLEDVPAEIACAPLRDVGTLAVAWAIPPPPASAEPTLEIQLVELSAASGLVLHEGPPRLGGMMTRRELATLAMGLLFATAVMLGLLVGGPVKAAWTIPQSVVLADHAPRAIAMLLDVVLAGLVCSFVLGVPFASAFAIDAIAREGGGEWGLFWTLGIGWAIGTASETAWGRSPGKIATGIGVTRVGEALAKPTLWQSAVRNACAWFAPQLAIFALLDSERRHRGDEASGCVIVQPRAAEDGG